MLLPIGSAGVSRDNSSFDQDGFLIPGPLPKLYGDGPDPINQEGLEDLRIYQLGRQAMDLVSPDLSSKESARFQMTQLCLYTRKKLIPFIVHHFTVIDKNKWSELFSPLTCTGNSPFYSACVDYFVKTKGDKFSNISIIFQDVHKLLPAKLYFGHNFLVAHVAHVKTDNKYEGSRKNSFIIDLTIRQFIKNARFREKEACFFNELLKNGFFELTEENFSIYQRFFKCYREDKNWFFTPGPEEISIEKLQCATSQNDYTDAELVKFLNPK